MGTTRAPDQARYAVLSAASQDRALVLAVLVVQVLNPQSGSTASPPSTAWAGTVVIALALTQSVPLLWRRTKAPTVLGVVAVAWVAAQFVAGAVLPVGLWVALYSVIVYSRRRGAAVTVMVVVGAVCAIRTVVGPTGWVDVAPLVIVTLLVVLGGFLVADRRARTDVLRERAAFLEREREVLARQAVAEERLRIARELHDLVAHSLSTIAIQSSTARLALPAHPDTALTALRGIEISSRDANREMRQLLGVLRGGDDTGGSLAPAPMLADIDELVDRLRSAGARIAVRTEGLPRPLPAGVELVAFRVVQEALTNVVRHTRPAAADVLVVYGDDELLVAVSDEGRGSDDDAGRRRPRDDALGGTGHGLLGMKERVDSVGGALTAGPGPGGGWRVRARLPLSRLEES